MLSQRTILLISVSGSVLLHAAILGTGAYYIEHNLLSSDQVKVTAPTKPEDKPEPHIVPQEPLLRVGHADSEGKANETTQGDVPQTALQSWTDQAYLGREPQGEMGKQPKPAMPETLATPAEQAIQGVQQQPMDFSKIALAAKSQPKPTPPEPIAQAQPPSPPQESQPNEKAPGNVTPQSDRDSDLFSETIAVDVTAGKVTARGGREFKFAKPRINLAAIVDMAAISFPAVLKVRLDVDETGKIRKVTILQSTGSSSLDRAYELAIYESWVEPKKLNGKPTRDQTEMALRIH